MKNMVPKLMGCRKSSSKRKVYSNTDLPHEKKNSYTQSISKTPRKKKKAFSRRKKPIQIRAQMETIKTEKINETKN